MNLEEEKQCKICFQKDSDTEDTPDVHPCKCVGSMKYVHASCLEHWLKISSSKRCELCHYDYKFKKIYKSNTPEKISFLVVSRMLIGKGISTLKKTLLILFNLFLKLCRIYSSSALFQFLFFKVERVPVFKTEVSFIIGICINLVGLILFSLFKKVKDKLHYLRRRRIHINLEVSRDLVDSIYTPSNSVLSTFYIDNPMESESYNVERDPLSNDTHPVESFGITDQDNLDAETDILDSNLSHLTINTPVEDALSGTSTDVIQESEDEFSCLRLCLPLKDAVDLNLKYLLYNLSLVLLLKMILLPAAAFKLILVESKFQSFLCEMHLEGLFCSLLSIDFSLALIMLFLCFSKQYSLYFNYMKVFFFIFHDLIFTMGINGLLINYLCAEYFDFNIYTDYAGISTVLCFSSGLIFTGMFSTIIYSLKGIYRSGSIYFIINGSQVDILMHILKYNNLRSIFQRININIFYWLVIYLTAAIQAPVISQVKYIMESYRIGLFYIVGISILVKRISGMVNIIRASYKVISFHLSKVFGLNDYLFGIEINVGNHANQSEIPNEIKNINLELNNATNQVINLGRKKKLEKIKSSLRWCPNGDKNYRRKFSNVYTDDEFVMYYLNRNMYQRMSLYTLPNYFKLNLFLLHAALFLIFQYGIFLILKLALKISTRIHLKIATEDLKFMYSVYAVLFLVDFLHKLVFFYNSKMILKKIVELIKRLVVYFFRIVVWPLLLAILAINSFANNSPMKNSVIPTINIYLSAIVVMHLVVELIGITNIFLPIEIMSFKELIYKLVMITNVGSSVVVCILVYDSVLQRGALMSYFGCYYLFFGMLIALAGSLMFYYSVVILNKAASFVINIRDELFLERREAMNCED